MQNIGLRRFYRYMVNISRWGHFMKVVNLTGFTVPITTEKFLRNKHLMLMPEVQIKSPFIAFWK